MDLRAEARYALCVHMMRSGLPLAVIADEMGKFPCTLIQFVSATRYGTPATAGEPLAREVLDWLKAHPVSLPEFEGTLHETCATRKIDGLIDEICEGAWGELYGPSGSQKTFALRYRAAEAARQAEHRMVLLECSAAGMTPRVLLARIVAALPTPFSQQVEGLRQQVYAAVRRRKASLGIVIDESDRFHWRQDTLETLREVGDALPARGSRPGVGILVVGNEKVMGIFRDRPGMYMEKWRGRISQIDLRVIGPSISEAREIILRELPRANDAQIDVLLFGDKEKGWEANVVKDPCQGSATSRCTACSTPSAEFRRSRRRG